MPQSRRTHSPTDDTSAIGSDEATSLANSQHTPLLIADAPADGWTPPRAVAYTAPQAIPSPAQDFDDPDLPYWLALNRVKGIGPARFKLLLDAFGTAEAAWRGTISAWQASGLDTRTANGLEQQRKRIVPEAEVERLVKLRVGVLRLSDATYPRLLREITLPPPVLYVRGTLTPEDDWAVAIVGTRRATAYGRQITERLATELAQHGITIVSGLARGIDTHAHTSALDAGSRTIAVLGCGPDLVYPPENAKLAARIVEHGCIITEFGPGTQPEAGNFPARNRLISGLSLGVLVAEAPDEGGAQIYAVDTSEWARCDSETSPERTFYCHPSRHSAGQPIVADWSYQWVAQFGLTRDSWTAPVDVHRLQPRQDVNTLAATQIMRLLSHLPAGTPCLLFAFEAGYDPIQVALDLGETPVAVLFRLRMDRCCYADPDPAQAAATGRPRRHGEDGLSRPGDLASPQCRPPRRRRPLRPRAGPRGRICILFRSITDIRAHVVPSHSCAAHSSSSRSVAYPDAPASRTCCGSGGAAPVH